MRRSKFHYILARFFKYFNAFCKTCGNIDFFACIPYNEYMEDPKTRMRAGVFASAVCIALNIVLAGAKIAAGLFSGLISIMVDGFNNVSDCGGAVVSLVSFRVSEKPADKEHPYGHRRAEYIASMIIGFIILFLAAELLRGSVEKIISGTLSAGSIAAYIVAGVSIAVKGIMAVYLFYMSKKTQSETLRAAGIDSACDCAVTLAVIAGMLAADFAYLPADGYVGAAVALFIAWQGIAVLKRAVSELLGRAPDRELVKGVREYLLSGKNVLGVHDLQVISYGRGVYYATAHVEMDADMPSLEAHAVLDGLEHGAAEKFGVSLTAHLDPIDLKDGEAEALKERVEAAVLSLGLGLEAHDIRLVRGARPNLVFDVVAPYALKLSNAEISKKIGDVLGLPQEYLLSVTVERG